MEAQEGRPSAEPDEENLLTLELTNCVRVWREYAHRCFIPDQKGSFFPFIPENSVPYLAHLLAHHPFCGRVLSSRRFHLQFYSSSWSSRKSSKKKYEESIDSKDWTLTSYRVTVDNIVRPFRCLFSALVSTSDAQIPFIAQLLEALRSYKDATFPKGNRLEIVAAIAAGTFNSFLAERNISARAMLPGASSDAEAMSKLLSTDLRLPPNLFVQLGSARSEN